MLKRARIYETTSGNLVYEMRLIADRASRSIYANNDYDDGYMVADEAKSIMADAPTIGEQYMIASSEYVGPLNGRANNPIIIHKIDNGFGFGGNSDPGIKRYHGWRGTSDDWAMHAMGVRRCLKVTTTGTRSKVVRFVFGKDLKPNEE